MQDKLLRAYIKGCNDSWDLIDSAMQHTPGIGPKTHSKIMEAIKLLATEEVKSVDNLRAAEQRKLYNTIDQIGYKGGQ